MRALSDGETFWLIRSLCVTSSALYHLCCFCVRRLNWNQQGTLDLVSTPWQLFNKDKMGVCSVNLCGLAGWVHKRQIVSYRTLIINSQPTRWVKKHWRAMLKAWVKLLQWATSFSHVNKPGCWPADDGLHHMLCNMRCCNRVHLWCPLKDAYNTLLNTKDDGIEKKLFWFSKILSLVLKINLFSSCEKHLKPSVV